MTTLTAAKKARPFLKKKIRVSPPTYPWTLDPKTHQKSWLSLAAHDDGKKLWKGFPPVGQRMFFGYLWQWYPLAVVSLKITFPKQYPNGGFLKWWYQTTTGFPTKADHSGVSSNSSLRPVLRRSSTAPANCSTCIGQGGLFNHLEWVFGPYKSQFKNDLPTQLSFSGFCLSTVSFQDHLVLVEPYLSFAGFVYPPWYRDTGWSFSRVATHRPRTEWIHSKNDGTNEFS